MKKLTITILLICFSWMVNGQTDSLAPYLNMSFEELLSLKVTTAGKQEQKISEIPASVVVITRADIEAYGYQSLKEILSNALGMYKIDDYKNVSFGVRGFFSNVYSRNLVFMINGVIQQQPYLDWNDLYLMNIQVESIERIEFVRGPVAIIYGNDAFFGAINIITHMEGNEMKSSVTTSYGNGNSYRGNFQINSMTKSTSINLSAGYYHTDGRDIPFDKILDSLQRYDGIWIKDGTTKDYFRQKSQYVNLTANHKGFYVHFGYDESYRNVIHFWEPLYDSDKNSKSDFLLRSSFGYRKEINPKLKFDAHIDFLDSYFTNGYLNVFHSTPSIKYGYAKSEAQNTTAEMIAFIKPMEKLNITIGTNYTITLRGYLDLDIPDLGYDRFSVNLNSPSSLLAVFSQAEYQVLPKVRFIAGLRADQQFDYEYKNIKFVSNVYRDTIYQYNYDKISLVPMATLVYSINPKNTLKLMYGKAISRPGIYENSFVNWELHPMLVPQTISTTELNYSSVMFPNLAFAFSLFQNKLDKLINRRVVTDKTTGLYVNENNNTGQLATIGGELQINYIPIKNLMLDVSFSYQKTTNLVFNIDAAYSPNWLAYFKANYYLTKDVVFALSGYVVGEMESEWDEINRVRISKTTPGYVNLSANIRFANLFKSGGYFSLHGDNLLNAEMFYPPTAVNSSYLPNGTYDKGMQIISTIGFKF